MHASLPEARCRTLGRSARLRAHRDNWFRSHDLAGNRNLVVNVACSDIVVVTPAATAPAALERKHPVDALQQLWRVSATGAVSVGELRRGVSCLGCMGMVMPGIHVALGDHEDGHAQKHRPVAPHR